MSTLPSHRQFLTTLLNSITTTSSLAASSLESGGEAKRLPVNRQELLLTLHVLFPSLLLPALDLLDRRLVSVISTPLGNGVEKKAFIVKSLATTLATRRTRDAHSSTAKSYLVETHIWNCSCASFAFDAFPVSIDDSGGVEQAELDWSFGGVSFDGLAGRGEDVPCCKHLLACLLAERWETILGAYIEHKEMSKEQFAGIIAGV
ncbi:uncharacterized protein F5Z01DRAFT_734032 [Emericellopsis atlantica]|uniref:SWIM-type domain-containing protein n=1 Tax=Emericellopsis atlantica TaxID=2614577 RepID=A0A9P7ZU22_9HYPO|nr:uncharacterized protein F5Z01DRAFT_734032 [Emericellopsis atlantica]KAG9257643.1 hypothetical protein F5Z01DRAFT_734032 [Emericellopsis atlantica]